MPFSNTGYSFTESGLASYAPTGSGVYGIYNSTEWIYIGETKNVEARLYEHLRKQSDQSGCIHKHKPTNFAFESADANSRVARQNGLIVEYDPACNKG